MIRKNAFIAGLSSLVLATSMGGGMVLAKGGASSSTSVPTSAGPCAYEWIIEDNFTRYPLMHGTYPGVVYVDISMATGVPVAQNVCLDAGWTVESKPVTDGIQLRFSYNGAKAIDFKYVLGKTDIKFL